MSRSHPGRRRLAARAGRRRLRCWRRCQCRCGRTRYAERAVLSADVVQRGVAVRAGADVEAGVVHVAGVRVVDQPGPAGVRGEDPVAGLGGVAFLEVRGGGRKVRAVVAVQVNLARAVPAVPPDLVARTGLAGKEVADRQVLDRHSAGLEYFDAVAPPRAGRPGRAVILVGRAGRARRPGLGAVDDNAAAAQPEQVQIGLVDVDPSGRRPLRRVRGVVAALLVVPRRDDDPVAGRGGVHGRLDGLEFPPLTLKGADGEHSRFLGGRGGGYAAHTDGEQDKHGGSGHRPPVSRGGSGPRPAIDVRHRSGHPPSPNGAGRTAARPSAAAIMPPVITTKSLRVPRATMISPLASERSGGCHHARLRCAGGVLAISRQVTRLADTGAGGVAGVALLSERSAAARALVWTLILIQQGGTVSPRSRPAFMRLP
jgi:hypothetical protein